MLIEDLLEFNGLSVDLLRSFSYNSQLGLSLKRTIHRFNRDSLLNELFDYADWLDSLDISSRVSLDFRIKAYESIENKYDRYYPNYEVYKAFNDILGFRAFCSNYDDVLNCQSDIFRIVNMTNGKAHDDGYRGVHLYFQMNNYSYPIEIQFNTLVDRQINNWLHDYLYKKDYPLEYGKILRNKYDQGIIRTEHDFSEVLYNDLLSSEE